VPDLFICPDCEQQTATQPGVMCVACTQWRVDKLTQMDHEYEAWKHRQDARRMTPNQRFAEALADIVKAVERSRR
jgi:hypothetical protein